MAGRLTYDFLQMLNLIRCRRPYLLLSIRRSGNKHCLQKAYLFNNKICPLVQTIVQIVTLRLRQ